MCPISISASFQISITLCWRFLSIISWGKPEISKLFLLLYCLDFAWLFSYSVTLFLSKVLMFFTTINWLLSTSFDCMSLARFSDKPDTWSQRIFLLLPMALYLLTFQFPWRGLFFSLHWLHQMMVRKDLLYFQPLWYARPRRAVKGLTRTLVNKHVFTLKACLNTGQNLWEILWTNYIILFFKHLQSLE